MKKPNPTFNHVASLCITCSNAILAGLQNGQNSCKREFPKPLQITVLQRILVNKVSFKVWWVSLNSSNALSVKVTLLPNISLPPYPSKNWISKHSETHLYNLWIWNTLPPVNYHNRINNHFITVPLMKRIRDFFPFLHFTHTSYYRRTL